MIFPLWPLFLLFSQLVLGSDHSIDLTRCKTDTACFVRESCLESGNDHTNILVKLKDERLKGSDCDVVLQFKLLSSYSQWHVMMQVKLGGFEKLELEDGLVLHQRSDQFVCKPDGISGATDFTFVQQGRQIFEDQHMFCSFIVKVKDGSDIHRIYKDNMARQKLIFTKFEKVKEEVVYQDNGPFMWRRAYDKQTSERVDITTSTKVCPTDHDIIWTEVDTIPDKFKCDTSFIILVKFVGDRIDAGSNAIVASNVNCSKATRSFNSWQFEASGMLKKILGDFELYCPVKRCRMCTTTPPPLSSCTGCTAPDFNAADPANPTACPKLTCPNNKWTITGNEIIVGEAECKQIGDDLAKFGWFLNGVELTEAACMEKIDCGAKFFDYLRYPTVLADCPGDTCKIKGLGTSHISCVDDGDRLRLMPGGYSFAEIECDFSTGRYMEMGRQPGDGLNFTSIECIPARSERRKFGQDRRPNPSN